MTEDKRLPSILLCGYERGGTTLLSQIFRENGFVGGFEVGVLLCKSPRDFLSYKPYVDMLRPGWKLGNRITLDELCSSDFEHFYHGLISTAFPKRKRAPAFDKTPIYMSRLGYALSRTEFLNKAVVITRDPRAVFVSWSKRALADDASPQQVNRHVESKLKYYSARYLDYFYGCIAHRQAANVHFVAYEDLCLNQQSSVEALGEFNGGAPFALTEMSHNYKNIYGNTISTENVQEYSRFLSPDTQRKVLQSTQNASPFFYSVDEAEGYLAHWESLQAQVQDLLSSSLLKATHEEAEGLYFEPETYLLKNPDVLARKINPAAHFQRHGRKEGRLAA